MNNSIIILILCLTIILFCFIFSLFAHEQIHIITNEKVGVESSVIFDLYDGWLPAVGVQRSGQPERDLKNYEMIHLQNEIISYNIAPLFVCIIIIMLFGFLYLGEIIKESVQQ